MRSEAAGALAVLAGVVVIVVLGLALKGCGDGPDLIGPAQPAAVTAGASCAPAPPPPDAGCDGADGCINPGTAGSPFPE